RSGAAVARVAAEDGGGPSLGRMVGGAWPIEDCLIKQPRHRGAHEMLNTKIRTAIIGLAATFSVAAAVGPMALAASAEYVRYHYQHCNYLYHAFEEDAELRAVIGTLRVGAERVECALACAWGAQAFEVRRFL